MRNIVLLNIVAILLPTLVCFGNNANSASKRENQITKSYREPETLLKPISKLATNLDNSRNSIASDSYKRLDNYINSLDDTSYNPELKMCYRSKSATKYFYKIPMNYDNPELIVLIMCSKNMDYDEKQYWYDIYPEMTLEQKQALYDFLSTELHMRIR